MSGLLNMLTFLHDPIDLQYSSADNSTIDCTLTLKNIGEIRYTATPKDVEHFGRALYQDLISGKYGPIAAYQRPKISEEQIAIDRENQKQQLLADASQMIAPLQDALDLNMATEEEKRKLVAWKKYRIKVSRLNNKKPFVLPDIPNELE